MLRSAQSSDVDRPGGTKAPENALRSSEQALAWEIARRRCESVIHAVAHGVECWICAELPTDNTQFSLSSISQQRNAYWSLWGADGPTNLET
jgi:hypothetical protein